MSRVTTNLIGIVTAAAAGAGVAAGRLLRRG
jgi:hypothetical protein